ncbi:Cyclic nucleotide-gated cation channel subunit A [Diplonema papillatum]|nr:Cyclic nucleotide-gated cation channel subunit A [Diplonema papillatum]
MKRTFGRSSANLLTEENLRPLSVPPSARRMVSNLAARRRAKRSEVSLKSSSVMERGVLGKSDKTIERLNTALRSECIQPDDMKLWYWDTLLMACCLYYGIFIPAQYAMSRSGLIAGEIGQTVLEVFASTIFIADIAVRLNTGYLDSASGTLVEDKRRIRAKYAQTGLATDVLAAMPVDLVLLLVFGEGFLGGWLYLSFSHLRLLKLLAVRRLFEVVTPVKLGPHSVKYQYSVVPMLRLVFYCALAINLITICWILLKIGGVRGTTDKEYSYVQSLYWAVMTVTTVGYGDVPVDTRVEQLFATFLFIVGVVVNGIVISKISSRMQKGDVESERVDKMKETLSVLNKFNIPDQLACEVLAFQYHQLHSDLSGEFMKVLSSLPSVMRNRVGLFVRMKFISQVPMFKHQPIECLISLANALKNFVLEPERRVIEAGDDGKEMFFLGHGLAEVTSPDGDLWGVIKPGGFFGEIALLTESKRTASITTLTYCELFRLDKGDFFGLIRKYSSMKQAVQEEMVKRQIQQSTHGTVFKLEMTGPSDFLGISWEEASEGFVVAAVDDNSAASRVGIVPGMHLASIEDEQVDSHQMLQLIEDSFQATGVVALTLLPPTFVPDSPEVGALDSEGRGSGSVLSHTGNTPFALDLNSDGSRGVAGAGYADKRISRHDSVQSVSTDGEDRPGSSPLRRKATTPTAGSYRQKLPDITLHPAPIARGSRPFLELTARLSRLEDRCENTSQTVQRVEHMVEALLNTLGLVIEKTSQPIAPQASQTHHQHNQQQHPAKTPQTSSFPDQPPPNPPPNPLIRPGSPCLDGTMRSLASLQEGASSRATSPQDDVYGLNLNATLSSVTGLGSSVVLGSRSGNLLSPRSIDANQGTTEIMSQADSDQSFPNTPKSIPRPAASWGVTIDGQPKGSSNKYLMPG